MLKLCTADHIMKYFDGNKVEIAADGLKAALKIRGINVKIGSVRTAVAKLQRNGYVELVSTGPNNRGIFRQIKTGYKSDVVIKQLQELRKEEVAAGEEEYKLIKYLMMCGSWKRLTIRSNRL